MDNKEIDFSFDWEDLWEDSTNANIDNKVVTNDNSDLPENSLAIDKFKYNIESDFPRLKLLGYYAFPNQKMYPEGEYPERAARLAELLSSTFNNIESLDDVSAHFKSVYARAVLIFRDFESNLYAYFPKDNIARITNVIYNKNNISLPARRMRGWFTPGEPFCLLNDESEK